MPQCSCCSVPFASLTSGPTSSSAWPTTGDGRTPALMAMRESKRQTSTALPKKVSSCTTPSYTPSRNAVITGKYHWELGPEANLWSTLPVEHESFIPILRDSGHRTGRNKAKTWGPGKVESWEEHHRRLRDQYLILVIQT